MSIRVTNIAKTVQLIGVLCPIIMVSSVSWKCSRHAVKVLSSLDFTQRAYGTYIVSQLNPGITRIYFEVTSVSNPTPSSISVVTWI